MTDLSSFKVWVYGHIVDDLTRDTIKTDPGEETMVLSIFFLMFTIGFTLAFLGIYMKNIYIVGLSGIWFMLLSVTKLINNDAFGWETAIFFIMFGILLFWQTYVLHNNKE